MLMAQAKMEDTPSADSGLRKEMIQRLANTDAHFKHQQRGEPDLTHDEKTEIATEILQQSPAKFLERFSKFLTLSDTDYFKDLKDDYVVDFYIKDIQSRLKDKKMNVVKNRRFQAMQGLMEQGDYFSESEMKTRDPLLFQQLVGQYETDTEKSEKVEKEIDKTDLKFSTILLKHMDIQNEKQMYEIMKEREEEQEEEEEESDEEEDTDEENNDEMKAEAETDRTDGGKGEHGEKKDTVSDMERILLKNEFLSIMQERFLAGEDQDFDYKTVDTNADFDSLDILNNDAEERYFDSEPPHSHQRHAHRMLTDSASDSSLSELGGGDSEMIDSCGMRQRFRALELQEQGCKSTPRTANEEDDMDSDDYMKFEVPDSKTDNQAVT